MRIIFPIVKKKSTYEIVYPDKSSLFTDVRMEPDGKNLTAEYTGTKTFTTAPALASQDTLSKIDFMGLFTDAELVVIYTAAKTSVPIEVWIKKLEAATEITLSNPATVSGINALESAGLIGAGRAQEILA